MAVASAGNAARQVKAHDATRGLARVGLAGHGVIWLLVGVLAVLLAAGSSNGETDQTGALQQLSAQPGGEVVLWALAVGLAAYGLWHLLQVFTGPMSAKDEAKERVACAVRAVVYLGTAASAVKTVTEGHPRSQARSQQSWTAKLMQHTGGQFLVGAIGLVVIGVGVYLVQKALRTKFEQELDLSTASPTTRKVVVFLGKWGGGARGVVVGLAGVLLLVSAVQYDPKKARGVDGALRALRDTPVGPWLLGLVAVGLLMFGAYGVSEAKFRSLNR